MTPRPPAGPEPDADLTEGGRPAAYALARENGDHVFLRHFAVSLDRTGRGLGRRLLAALADRYGHPELRVAVAEADPALPGFWRRLGFAEAAVTMARPGEGTDEGPD